MSFIVHFLRETVYQVINSTSLDFETKMLEFKSWLCHLESVLPQANNLCSLYFWEIIHSPIRPRILKIPASKNYCDKWAEREKYLEQFPAHGKCLTNVHLLTQNELEDATLTSNPKISVTESNKACILFMLHVWLASVGIFLTPGLKLIEQLSYRRLPHSEEQWKKSCCSS